MQIFKHKCQSLTKNSIRLISGENGDQNDVFKTLHVYIPHLFRIIKKQLKWLKLSHAIDELKKAIDELSTWCKLVKAKQENKIGIIGIAS